MAQRLTISGHIIANNGVPTIAQVIFGRTASRLHDYSDARGRLETSSTQHAGDDLVLSGCVSVHREEATRCRT